MTQNSTMENYGKVVSKAWTDAAFKAKLKSDPAAALKELGMDLPDGININVVEDEPNSITLVLPAAPTEGDLSAEDLGSISGGTPITTTATFLCMCN